MKKEKVEERDIERKTIEKLLMEYRVKPNWKILQALSECKLEYPDLKELGEIDYGFGMEAGSKEGYTKGLLKGYEKGIAKGVRCYSDLPRKVFEVLDIEGKEKFGNRLKNFMECDSATYIDEYGNEQQK